MSTMDRALYWLVRGLVAIIQGLPLRWVARLGRWGGGLGWWLDGRHRRVALENLGGCFGGRMSEAEIRGVARENFRRLGENYASALKTSGMSPKALAPHFDLVGAEKLGTAGEGEGQRSRVVAIGHFGNFELYARFGQFVAGYQGATTYRGLRQEALNRFFQSLRERSGCRYFERRREAGALKAAMTADGLLLGLLSDQHAGDGGLRMPFFGRDCSTSAAPALFALRYRCPLHTAICYRVELGRWRIEIGDEIPTVVDGRARPVAEIMADVNAAFEVAIRRDPANWFWVHRRWKPAPPGRVREEQVPEVTVEPG